MFSTRHTKRFGSSATIFRQHHCFRCGSRTRKSPSPDITRPTFSSTRAPFSFSTRIRVPVFRACGASAATGLVVAFIARRALANRQNDHPGDSRAACATTESSGAYRDKNFPFQMGAIPFGTRRRMVSCTAVCRVSRGHSTTRRVAADHTRGSTSPRHQRPFARRRFNSGQPGPRGHAARV